MPKILEIVYLKVLVVLYPEKKKKSNSCSYEYNFTSDMTKKVYAFKYKFGILT